MGIMKPIETRENIEQFKSFLKEVTLNKLENLLRFYWLENTEPNPEDSTLEVKMKLIEKEIEVRNT